MGVCFRCPRRSLAAYLSSHPSHLRMDVNAHTDDMLRYGSCEHAETPERTYSRCVDTDRHWTAQMIMGRHRPAGIRGTPRGVWDDSASAPQRRSIDPGRPGR